MTAVVNSHKFSCLTVSVSQNLQSVTPLFNCECFCSSNNCTRMMYLLSSRSRHINFRSHFLQLTNPLVVVISGFRLPTRSPSLKVGQWLFCRRELKSKTMAWLSVLNKMFQLRFKSDCDHKIQSQTKLWIWRIVTPPSFTIFPILFPFFSISTSHGSFHSVLS